MDNKSSWYVPSSDKQKLFGLFVAPVQSTRAGSLDANSKPPVTKAGLLGHLASSQQVALIGSQAQIQDSELRLMW